MTRNEYNPPLHAVALLTAAATFPLIFLGGLVTSHHAGMSVPDWPNSWGYNMFTFPPSKWVGGILFEHTHRLGGSIVGMLSIALVITAWWTGASRKHLLGAVAIFLAVLAQGILGGLRVVLSDLDLAIVHGCCAQLLFCLMAAYCVWTSRFWQERPTLAEPDRRAASRITRIAVIAMVIVFCQLVVGAIMRHEQAGLAIPDFPLSYGHLLPPTHIDNSFRLAAIHRFGTNLGLNTLTLFAVWIHFAHRVGAVFVSAALLWLTISIFRTLRRQPIVVRPAITLLVLLAVQITLGILTVLLRKPADIASSHVAVGSLIFMTAGVTLVRAWGLAHPRPVGGLFSPVFNPSVQSDSILAAKDSREDSESLAGV